MMVGYIQVIFSILPSNMVDELILASLQLFSLLLYPPASCAGVAAAAEEVAKDDKHLAAVEKLESPLVVECFEVWTLFDTVDRTPHSEVLARINLLFVALWMGIDIDDNPLVVVLVIVYVE